MQKMYLNLLVAALLTLPMQSLWAQEDEPAEAEAPVVYDELLLNNGSRILGKVLTYRDGSVQIETDFAGTLTIAAENIASLNTQNPGILQMVDGQILHNATVAAADGQLTISADEGAGQDYPLEELLLVNPEPWELGQGYKWSGLINFAFAVERGNTDTDELDYEPPLS